MNDCPDEGSNRRLMVTPLWSEGPIVRRADSPKDR